MWFTVHLIERLDDQEWKYEWQVWTLSKIFLEYPFREHGNPLESNW